MRFQDIQDIDVLDSCLEPINEIFNDTEIFTPDLIGKTVQFPKIAKRVWLKHEGACKRLFEILKLKPNGILDNIMYTSAILTEATMNPELLAFFTTFCDSAESFFKLMANTAENAKEKKQSETTSDMSTPESPKNNVK